MRCSLRATAVLLAVLVQLAACGGGGGGPAADPLVQAGPVGPGASPTATTHSLSGKATFDHVPNVEGKLRYDATQVRPIEGAPLEVIDAVTGEVLAVTQTAAQGAWTATVPTGRPLKVRVIAQLKSPGRWSVDVRDNTQGGALYAIETPVLDAGQAGVHLHAASGWTGNGYGAVRAAAPFAILATLRASQAKVLSADASAVFPPLAVYWSPRNLPAMGDRTLGEIGVTHFRRGDDPMAIYVLGQEDVDTDEYDESVVAHEWGHYYQAVFSRNDSLDGPHDHVAPLEMTVAFSEGWGDAWQAIALGRTDYADSLGARQEEAGGFFLLAASHPLPGWFSERSVAAVIAGLAQQAGLGVVHRAMQALRTTPAYTGIHAFSHAVRRQDPAAADALDVLLRTQGIVASRDSDEFGRGETNDGGLKALDIDQPQNYYAPLYLPLPDNRDRMVMVCSSAKHGRINKHGLYRALRFDVPATGHYELRVMTADGSYPYVSWLAGGRRVHLRGSASQGSQVLALTPGPFVLSVADGRVRDAGQPADYDCPFVSIGRLPPAPVPEN